MNCGWLELEADLALIMEGDARRVRLPIPSVLIEHRDGIALFDTGLHADPAHDTSRMRSNQKLFRIRIETSTGDDVGHCRARSVHRRVVVSEIVVFQSSLCEFMPCE